MSHHIRSVVLLGFITFLSLCAIPHSQAYGAGNQFAFYGTQFLKPMVKESKTTIYLPSGAKLETEIEGDKTKYHLTDHLQSTRLAVATDKSASSPMGYTPFGDNPNPSTIHQTCLLYTSPSPRDRTRSRMPSSA